MKAVRVVGLVLGLLHDLIKRGCFVESGYGLYYVVNDSVTIRVLCAELG